MDLGCGGTDWNGDGKVDGMDDALFHEEIIQDHGSGGGSAGGSGGGSDLGKYIPEIICLILLVVSSCAKI